MENIKKQRGVAKSSLTKAINNVKQFIEENDKESVLSGLEIVKEKFKLFKEKHEEYHRLLVEDAYDHIEESDTYFLSAQNSYIDSLRTANAYIKEESKRKQKK